MESTRIILSRKFNRIVSTRVAIENLFKDLKGNEIIIDFSDIHFISSSAAHQIVTEIKRYEKQNITVTCEKMNKDVFRMLELAKTDRKNIFTFTPIIKHQVVRTESELYKTLLGSI